MGILRPRNTVKQGRTQNDKSTLFYPPTRGGLFLIWTRPSFFCPFLTFPIFPGFPRFVRGLFGGFSRCVLFLFLGLLTAPTRNSPERVRGTIWTFPEKSEKPLGLETPRGLASANQNSSPEKAHKHKETTPKIGPQTPPPQTLKPPPLKFFMHCTKMTPA